MVQSSAKFRRFSWIFVYILKTFFNLQNAPTLTIVAVHTAENEPLKVRITDHTFDHIPSVLHLDFSLTDQRYLSSDLMVEHFLPSETRLYFRRSAVLWIS